MDTQSQVHYDRIAEAIQYIKDHFQSQPDLEEVARQVHLSPHYFQRLFKQWAGVSPKKFLQYISVEHAKKILAESASSLFQTALDTGLSGTGRLHDLFVKIEGMTPGEYKKGGQSLTIQYTFADSIFGKILVANTEKGLCHLAFAKSEATSLKELKDKFPNAQFLEQNHPFQNLAIHWLMPKSQAPSTTIPLHLKGTEFQLKIWEALLKIPSGHLATYGHLAQSIDKPKASRAVGTAIGANPIAYLIPCHRVIRTSGVIGEYRWGSTRKTAIIGWETAQEAR
jgi:AraC family transcriptional regulator of adaptative response/methylated-DNA-[protein]-cysteine methyltransferase